MSDWAGRGHLDPPAPLLSDNQLAKPWLQEEIDEEALPCLTILDLQSLGVRNHAHQRLILSAAMQPALQKPAKPLSNSALTAPPHTSSSQAADTRRTDTSASVLPIKALPRNGLHSIACALAASQTKAGVNASRSGTGQMTAEVPPRESCVPHGIEPLSVATSVAGAAGLTGSACATAKGVVPAVKAGSATAKGASTIVVAGTARHSTVAAKSVKVTVRSNNAAAQRAVTSHTQTALAAAPQSKAEEARQLALALSASLGKGSTSTQSSVFWSCVVCSYCECCLLH